MIDDRIDLSSPEQRLQIAALNFKYGNTFIPHYHIYHDVNYSQAKTQEAWIIIAGKVKMTCYDTDNTIIDEVILYPGDCSITFNGGHNYVSLEDNTLLYEVKTGPYYGIEKDKKRF